MKAPRSLCSKQASVPCSAGQRVKQSRAERSGAQHTAALSRLMMLQGLDYVLAQSCQHGLRVVLTLTNYLTAYGGMQTWVQWFGGKSVSEFYTNPTIV